VSGKGVKAEDESFIKVKVPNAPEYWMIGTQQQIRWTHNLGRKARFRIEVSRDSGASWQLLAEDVAGRKYGWEVSGPGTQRARIRVSEQKKAP
jgi:hypothetical protein